MSCEGIDTSGIPLTAVNLQLQMRHAIVIKLLEAHHFYSIMLKGDLGCALSLLSAPAFQAIVHTCRRSWVASAVESPMQERPRNTHWLSCTQMQHP